MIKYNEKVKQIMLEMFVTWARWLKKRNNNFCDNNLFALFEFLVLGPGLNSCEKKLLVWCLLLCWSRLKGLVCLVPYSCLVFFVNGLTQRNSRRIEKKKDKIERISRWLCEIVYVFKLFFCLLFQVLLYIVFCMLVSFCMQMTWS